MAYKSVDSSNQFEVLQKLRNIRQDHKTFFYMSAWTIEKKSHFIDMSADEIYPDKTKNQWSFSSWPELPLFIPFDPNLGVSGAFHLKIRSCSANHNDACQYGCAILAVPLFFFA